jgi:hypothetical protein
MKPIAHKGWIKWKRIPCLLLTSHHHSEDSITYNSAPFYEIKIHGPE